MFDKNRKPSTPPAVPGGETANTTEEIQKPWFKAGEMLSHLFGTIENPGAGALHMPGTTLAKLEENDGWRKFLNEIRDSDYCRTLAIVSSSHANPAYKPELVAELFTTPYDDGEPDESVEARTKRFASNLNGLAQIFVATGGEGVGVGLVFSLHKPRLDFVGAAYNAVTHVSEADRKRLNLYLPDEVPGRYQLSADPLKMVAQLASNPMPRLTEAQQVFRWAIRKWELREAARRRRNHGAGGGDDTTDQTAGLPPAPKAAPEPPEAPGLPPPPTTTTAASNVPAAPKPTRNKKQAAPPAQNPLPPAPPPPASSAGTNGLPAVPTAAPAAAANSDSDDRKLIMDAIAGSGIAGKAMVAMVNTGQRTFDDAVAFATQKGIL